MKSLVERIAADEAGVEVVEYAILTGIIVVSSLLSMTSIGAWVLVQFQAVVS